MPSSSSHNTVLRFGAFAFDTRTGILRKNSRSIPLQPQPGKVLALLISRPGELITREEIQLQVWGEDTFVDFEHSINFAVRQIREALKDDAEKPRFVETLPRRGYRFIASVEEAAPSPPAFRGGTRMLSTQRRSVGRQKERAELATAFEAVAGGRGTLICIAGEPGIGKTTLVQDFLSDLQVSGRSFAWGMGRCSQRLAGEEAYLPFLEALDGLLRSDGLLSRTLRDFAPSWYAQLFPLSESNASDAAVQAHARATTQEKIKRELAAFFCEITRQSPLVLFFDDVHWTDPSTIDLLSHLATKFDSTRILVIVTYRPSELLLLKHPFIGVKRELQGRTLCREIEVEFLSPADVERYIKLEFLANRFPREFARLIHSRTEGNPLFMVDLLRYLRDRKVIVKTDEDASWHLAESLPDLSRNIPQSVNGVIERKIDQLSDRDREALTAAAVEGYEFDSTALARALGTDNIEIEEILDRLERVHAFAKRVGEDELSGSTPTVRYRFVHVLYQNALYTSLTPSQRVALSAALANALEGLYGNRTSMIATHLAFLYETARDPGRALDYFLLAAQNAQQIFANQEAIALAQHGLALLYRTPESPERTRKELELQVTLGFSWICTRGYAAPEAGTNMARARELCRELGDTAQLSPVLFGLWVYYFCKGDLKAARETAEHMASISSKLNEPAQLLMAHGPLAFTLEWQGEFVASHREFEEAIRYYDPADHQRYMKLYRMDAGLQTLAEMTRTLWVLGFPDLARRQMDTALARARELSVPVTLAFCQRFAAMLYQNIRDPEKVRECGEACIALCDEHGILLERAWALCQYGWAMAQHGQVEQGISHICAGLDAQLSVGAELARPYFKTVSAEVLWQAGRLSEALQAVEDGFAVASRNGEHMYDAELWRLKGELWKTQDKTAEAESCFQKAIEIARQQAAKSFELRASTSLARLWQKQGKRQEARQVLGETYAWFTEGFDTADLKEAASLLKGLS